MDEAYRLKGRRYGKTALMWGGLLTLFAALFHIGILIAGPDYVYLAGVPNLLAYFFPFKVQFWISLVILILIVMTYLAMRWSQDWPNIINHRVRIGLIALLLLIWGITGAPISHLNDWSHAYSLFHVGAAFFITLTGSCFAIAAWSLRQD